MWKLSDMVVNAIYPPDCPICGKPLLVQDSETVRACRECETKLRPVLNTYCLKCGKGLQDMDEAYCFDCKKTTHFYEQGASVFVYTDGIKQSIYRFKYKGRREYARWYGEMMKKYCGDRIKMWNPQVIIPVPLHADKIRSRGYNQAELLAKELGKNVGIPVNTELLKRSKNTAPMKKLDNEERAKNLKNAFIIDNKGVKYNKVLLVDDIYTTGATVDACAKALKENGVDSVHYISLCVGVGI